MYLHMYIYISDIISEVEPVPKSIRLIDRPARTIVMCMLNRYTGGHI